MADWNMLCQYVKSTYNVAKEEPGLLKFVFSTFEGRSQMVLLVRQTMGNDEWVQLGSPIGKLDDIELTVALREADEYIVGGLVLSGDILALRHSVPLANLDVNEFEEPLKAIVIAADAMEKKFSIIDAF
jgi:hypothetical protein